MYKGTLPMAYIYESLLSVEATVAKLSVVSLLLKPTLAMMLLYQGTLITSLYSWEPCICVISKVHAPEASIMQQLLRVYPVTTVGCSVYYTGLYWLIVILLSWQLSCGLLYINTWGRLWVQAWINLITWTSKHMMAVKSTYDGSEVYLRPGCELIVQL